MLEEVERWLSRRSWSAADRPLDRLLAAKRATGTHGERRAARAERGGDGRRDRRGDPARADVEAGAARRRAGGDRLRFHRPHGRGRRGGGRPGRAPGRDPAAASRPCPARARCCGARCWSTSGDIVCFVDADLKEFSADFVSGIVGPLLTEPDVQLVKAMYDRPLGDAPRARAAGSPSWSPARCSTCTGRSWPASSSRWAASTRPAARCWSGCPFPVGYGVELGLLVDALHTVGLDALAQVDVGVRKHRHQDGQALGPDGRGDLPHGAAAARPRPPGTPRAHPVRTRASDGFVPRTHPVDTEERPPMRGDRGVRGTESGVARPQGRGRDTAAPPHADRPTGGRRPAASLPRRVGTFERSRTG